MPVPTCNPMSLAERRVLVTGASSGIGRAAAILISRLGGRVVCVGRDSSRLNETRDSLDGDGHAVSAYDLADLQGIPDWCRSIAAAGGPLYGLVHAAGLQHVAPLQALTLERWRTLLAVNTEAALVLAKAFRSRGVYAGGTGSIVFVSSIMALVSAPGLAAYSLTKGALVSMARALALEMASQGIRVNCVLPSFVRTPMYDQMGRIWTKDQFTQVEQMHPLGVGTSEDVAAPIAFLLSEAGRWVTGSALVVDGGFSLR